MTYEGLSGADFCHMEGHLGDGPYCPRCGRTNFELLSYLGRIGKAAKRWGCTRDEAEARMYGDGLTPELPVSQS